MSARRRSAHSATRCAPRPGASRRPSSSRPRPSRPRRRTGRTAASGCGSCWRNGRPRRGPTVRWKRLSAARNAFNKRRKAYFAELTEERDEAKARKESLCEEAEALADSTDWSATAAVFRELMRSWKAAGRASRTDEDELWTRFKTAQDTFFRARAEVYSAKDAALREHAAVKTELLEEAGKLVPVTDVRAARAALRGIQERWEQAGPVPREAHERLES